MLRNGSAWVSLPSRWALASLALVLFITGPLHAQPISRSQFTVTDGDTIHVHGQPKGTRLVGLNAPEIDHPLCQRERQLGERAKARLNQLLAGAKLDLTIVPCACRPGTEGTDACNYGRSCGVLKADGRDVGQVLISEDLAVPFVCRGTGCPSTPRPWCE